MITEIVDLEQLLTQYESEAILVGPLLNLSISASYRYFHLAGNGGKVYCLIGLGFLENESHAQKQRADIIEKLRPRFSELVLFDSHMEMTRAVNARWRTEETARVLAAAEREAKAACAPQADDEPINERGYQHTLRDEQTERLLDRELQYDQGASLVSEAYPTDGASVVYEHRPFESNLAGQLAGAADQSLKSRSCESGSGSNDQFHGFVGTLFDNDLAKPDQCDGPTRVDMTAELPESAVSSNHEPDNVVGRNTTNGSGALKRDDHKMGNLAQEVFEHAARDKELSIRLPPAASLPPLTKGCGEAPAKRQSRDCGLTQDDIASAILKLASPARGNNDPIAAVDPGRSLPESPAVFAVEPTPVHPESTSTAPVKLARGQTTFRSLATTAVATVLFSSFVVPSAHLDVEQADSAFSADVTNLPSKSAAAVPTLTVSQRTDASQSARPTEAAFGTASLRAATAPSQAQNGGAGAVPVSEQHQAITQQAGRADLPESKEIANLVSRGMESLKSGDLESARQSLQRAVDAIPGPTAGTVQIEPSRTVPRPDASQRLPVKQPGPQTEHSPLIKPSSDAGQPSQLGSLEPGGPPTSGQTAPAREGGDIQHLNPDEIAILFSRGMDFLKSGDFASARLSLRRAAEAGNADAALALGSTYDPLVLPQLGAIGTAADIAQARQWYQKAMDFGSAAAAQRLARLSQTAR